MKPTHCHHCHMPLLTSGRTFRTWCQQCTDSPEGKCPYCKGDVLEAAYCWPLQQELDRAIVRANMGTVNCCAQCKTPMGVAFLTDTKASFICPRCGRQMNITWTWSKKAERGKPGIDPDGPLPTF